MLKADALQLREGNEIEFGDSMRTADIVHWETGQVEWVTPKGAIKILGGGYVPYHHVVRVLYRSPKPKHGEILRSQTRGA
jgi:hypothetical protein